MKRFFILPLILIALALFAAPPAAAQWQQIGNEQLPDDLEADSFAVETIQALDADGLSIRNSNDQLGLFVGAEGNIGVRESDFEPWSTSFQAIEFGSKGAFMAGSSAIHVLFNAYYDGSAWRYIASDYASGYYQSQGGHFFRTRASTGSPDAALTWTDALQITNSGRLRLGNDAVLQIGPDTTSNTFQFGSPVRLEVDADDGSLRAEGKAEFGSDASTLVFFQPAAEAVFGPASTEGMVHDAASDAIHPATYGAFETASFPSPWLSEGTHIQSAKFIVLMGTSSDRCNFAVRVQSSAAPGTTTDLVGFAGTDHGSGSGLTGISGNHYQRNETIDYTIGAGEKIWAVVRLKGDAAGEDAQLLGIEWTFEKRVY